MKSQKELKNKWLIVEEKKLDKLSDTYVLILFENQEYLDEGVMDTLAKVFNGGKYLITRTFFPVLAVNDLSNILENSKIGNEVSHFTLDVAGFVPGIGEIADGINAAWYIKKEQWFNAAMSVISLLPVAGDIIGKGAKWLGKESKGLAKFIGKYGDDIAKLWNKYTGNKSARNKLKANFKKLVDAVGGEKEFDNALDKMTDAIDKALGMKEKAKKEAKNTTDKIIKNPKLQQQIAKKVAEKQKYQEALNELQTQYNGINNSAFPDVYQYNGYSDAIDQSASGSGELEEDSIKSGRKIWQEMINNNMAKQVLAEDQNSDNIIKTFTDIKNTVQQGIDKKQAQEIIDKLLDLDYELQNISKRAGHEVTFSNVAISDWTTIIDGLRKFKKTIDSEHKAILNYLIQRNGTGIKQATSKLGNTVRKNNHSFAERIGKEIGNKLDKQMARYLISLLKNNKLFQRFNQAFLTGLDISTNNLDIDVITKNELTNPLTLNKFDALNNIWTIGKTLGIILSEKFKNEELSRVKYSDANDSGTYVSTTADKLKDLMDPSSYDENQTMKKDLIFGITKGIVDAHKAK